MEIQIVWNVCRICLLQEFELGQGAGKGAKQMRNILDDIELVRGIKDCTGIKVSAEENLPTKICDSCYMTLQRGIEFRRQCQRSNEILKGVLKQAQTKFMNLDCKAPIDENDTGLTIEKQTSPVLELHNVDDFDTANQDDNETNMRLVFEIEEDCTDHMDSNGNSVIEESDFDISLLDDYLSDYESDGGITISSDGDVTGSAHSSCVLEKVNSPEKIDQRPALKQTSEEIKLSSIFLHNLRQPNDEWKYECELCGKRFKFSGNLKVHVCNRSEKITFTCRYCKRKFADRITQIKHERVHSRAFKCDICNLTFPFSTSLKVHERIHTRRKPFSCLTCGKSFKLLQQLNVHLTTLNHKISLEKFSTLMH